MDEKPMQKFSSLFQLHDRIFDTGEVCPKCGEHIMALRMVDPVDGHPVLWKKPCACRDATVRLWADFYRKGLYREKPAGCMGAGLPSAVAGAVVDDKSEAGSNGMRYIHI